MTFSKGHLQTLVVLLLAAVAQTRRVIRAAPGEETTGNYIVVLRPETNHSRFETILNEVRNESIDSTISEKVEGPFAKIVAAKISEEAAHRLKHEDGVEFIEEETFAHGTATSWAIDRIDQVSSVLDDSTFKPCECGRGVDIYVLDSGINYNHCEFDGRAKYPGSDPVDDYDSTTLRGSDCHGHGTHTSSLAAGKSYGVARCATVYSVRVLRCNNAAPWSVVVNGLNYAANRITSANPRRPAVISMSLGGSFTTTVDNVITSVLNKGIPIVAAAGNDRGNACQRTPASNSRVITVGGTARGDGVYYYTNGGSCIDILAPASSVVAADHTCTTCTCTKTLSGTSMATPLVAGAVALMLEKEPSLTLASISQRLKDNCIKNAISYTDLPSTYRSTTNNCLLHIEPCNATCGTNATLTSTVTSTQVTTSTRVVTATVTSRSTSIVTSTAVTTRTVDITATQILPTTITVPTTVVITPSPTPSGQVCCETLRNFEAMERKMIDNVNSIVNGGINTMAKIVNGENWTIPCNATTPPVTFKSCADLLHHSLKLKSGYYFIQVNNASKMVYCDLEKEFNGTRGFVRIANVNMSVSGTQCPDGLLLRVDGSRKTCQRTQSSRGCSSTYFNTSGIQYSKVCGRIRGYQWASPNAFYWYQRNKHLSIDDTYVDGVVLTYQNNSKREHIWTFAGAIDEYQRSTPFVCECTNKNVHIGFVTPSFVGEDYFCETGSRNRFQYGVLYTDDPLWDGKGCGEVNTCCQRGQWFCKDVRRTSSDIELRLCGNEDRSNEDTPLEIIELYVQ